MADITLDMINDFFKVSKPIPKAPVVASIRGPPQAPTDKYREPEFKLPKKPYELSSPPPTPGFDYFNGFDEASSPGAEAVEDVAGLNELELENPQEAVTAAPTAAPFRDEDEAHIYDNYVFHHEYSHSLPITKFREEIVDTIESNSVTIVQGATGSGKTTQVPQYILDNYAQQRRYCNIIVTQPRRIAAISIAKRVCQERDWTLGSVVGYQVARDKSQSEDTRLSYVTTGVLLQKLITTKNMNQYTHVIIDEVHERDQETDFCLLVVRKMLRTNSRHVKVILMSATLESDLFSRYFAMSVRGNLEGAPVVSVEGRGFPVQEFYLEDLGGIFPDIPSPTFEDPAIEESAYVLAARLIKYFDSLEAHEQGVVKQGGFAPKRGTVLMFLPGYPEIARMDSTLELLCKKCVLWILPLHSQITNEEQAQVFKTPPEKQRRKVILSTNIAESSITVPDIKYVIDFCLVKHLLCDPETNFQSLRMQWASKANAVQRKGRAGRVSEGLCYRLVNRKFYDVYMPEYGLPEMQRCPLEQIVLQVKLLDLGEPRVILGLALQPPREEDIMRTVLLLKQVGAMTTKMRGGRINPYDGDLTFVGRVLGNLPVDVRIGKFLVLGYAFGCLEECLIIGAALSLKSVFARQFKEELKAYRSKMAWSDFSFSDCIAVLNVYKEWTRNKRHGVFNRGSSRQSNWRQPDEKHREPEREWCKNEKVQLGRLREVDELAKELGQRLERLNLRSLQPLYKKSFSEQDYLILKLVIAGAFYPNYFLSSDIDEKDAIKMMSGHNPFTTVMVKGVPPYGAQYRSNIACHFRPCGKGKALHFEESRAYIEFEPRGSLIVAPAVYMALKMRQLRMPVELYLSEARNKHIEKKMKEYFPLDDKTNRLRSSRTATFLTPNRSAVTFEQEKQVLLPHNGYAEIFVTEVINAGHMWAQLGDQETQARITQLQVAINKLGGRDLQPIPRRDINSGMVCLAEFCEEFYRARVVCTKGPEDRGTQLQVHFLDWGNTAVVELSQVRQITLEMLQLPFQAFECELCEVKPAYSSHSGITWSPKANGIVREITNNKRLVAKVYSQLRGVLRIDLYDTTTEEDIHINQLLINEGQAEFMEEPYTSRMAHQQAEGIQDAPEVKEDDSGWMETAAKNVHVDDREAIKVVLSGPFNPYELSFYSVTAIGRMRVARVERDSVNSVVISDSPQDNHQRFLVAANVGISQSGSNTIPRETTLMPNIHGLLPMVALLFAPCAELRTDPNQHQLTGAVVGLGYDPATNEPLLHDHDIELTFDVEFNNDDIATINNIRRSINFAVANEGNLAEWGSTSIRRIQKAAGDLILELVLKRRQDIKPIPYSKPFRWNQVAPENILYADDDSENDFPLLYVLHNAVAVTGQIIEEKPSPELLRRRESMKKLEELAGRSSEPFPEEVVCELCNVLCRHPRGVSLHLNSRLHKEEYKQLFEPTFQM